MKVRGAYAIYPPLGVDSGFHRETYKQLIDYLRTPRRLKVRGSFAHNGEHLLVRADACPTSFKKKFFKDRPFLQRTNHIIEFSGSFEFPGTKKFFVTDHTGTVIPHSSEELRSFWRSWLPDHLDLTTQTYLCGLMIAFPGAARTTENVWFLNGQRHSFSRSYVSIIHESIEYLIENGMPVRTDIDPEKIAKWVFSQNGIFDGYSNTPAARSLNYFTRLFVEDFREDEIGDLVWALAGIESLLVIGGRSSVGQLKEKLVAMFGSEQNGLWLRDMIEKTYGYRSRMVHGDRQIKSAFRVDESPDHDNRFNEEYESTRFAVGILLVLLQEAIERNYSQFSFKTVYDNRDVVR